MVRHMGREETELWYEEKDFTGIKSAVGGVDTQQQSILQRCGIFPSTLTVPPRRHCRAVWKETVING